jgi:PTS system mannose-specific IIB component/fructoselysine and glucoselysine-specific PTS system IIB component
MPIVLHRVDERLIHGQVVVGWGGQLRPDRYLVVDQLLAASQWEQELYTLGVPEKVEVDFVTADEGRDRLPDWRASELRSVLLTRDLATMLDLARAGLLRGEKVNLGGLHLRKGREEVLPYLFLDPTDRKHLHEMEAEGVLISAQDLPSSSKVPLENLLG